MRRRAFLTLGPTVAAGVLLARIPEHKPWTEADKDLTWDENRNYRWVEEDRCVDMARCGWHYTGSFLKTKNPLFADVLVLMHK